MPLTLEQFRKSVVRDSLFPPCRLGDAINRMGFVQADPIRSPARAQDLILRHRVKNYCAGDLEKQYPKLGLEECFLFAYGFLPRDLWQIIHPNTNKELTRAEREILELINQIGPLHPRALESHIGTKRVKNYWGGYSRSAKMALEHMHDRGALRIAHRENGIRIYEATELCEPTLSKKERFQEIIVATLKSMGAVTRRFLLSELRHFNYLAKTPAERGKFLDELIRAGRVRVDVVDNVEYVSLEQPNARRRDADELRILAPFDPIVRDRTRFEHLWNWTYRFEAYTPKAKRKLGYYAMPVLWREDVIGWANASVDEGNLNIEFGYSSQRPRDSMFKQKAEFEVARMATFLGLEERLYKFSI